MKSEAQQTLEYVLREGSINSADRIYIESAIRELDHVFVFTDAQQGFLYGLLESVLAIAMLRGLKDHRAMAPARELLELLK